MQSVIWYLNLEPYSKSKETSKFVFKFSFEWDNTQSAAIFTFKRKLFKFESVAVEHSFKKVIFKMQLKFDFLQCIYRI